MAPIRNGRVIFNSIPEGFPEPGKTMVYDGTGTIDIETVPLNGGFLLKTLVLSLDPYMRGRMRDPKIKSYSPPFHIGKPMEGFGIGVVLRSENNDVNVRDYIYGLIPHTEYTILPSLKGLQVIKKHPKLPLSVYVGSAGMAGQTAFMGWKEHSHAKKGETVFVTTGGGPVGSLVIQLAKLEGLKVIASAGSDKKVQFMKSIGADVAFNYKTTNTSEVLEKEGGIDIFWDNVGGESLDNALAAAKVGARFIECGSISTYNEGPKPVFNMDLVFNKSLSLNGFIVYRLAPKYIDEFYATVPELLANGKIKYTEEVFEGLEKVEDVMISVLRGTNNAKAVIKVADEWEGGSSRL